MDKIFIDLEFCKINRNHRKERSVTPLETIEIGAVRLNERDEIIAEFDAFVRPEYGVISERISQLTHITNKDVEGADTFSHVMEQFMDWVGSEEVQIYSWSMTDYLQLEKECLLKGYTHDKLGELFDNWFDFQNEFGLLLNIEQQISLENALKSAEMSFEGAQHRACNDARNTARLYAFTKTEDIFKEKMKVILEALQPSPALTTSFGSFFTPEILSAIQ